MRKLFLAVAVGIIFLSGCAKKEELKIFSVDRPYAEALRWSKKGDIAISLENKALLIATYLNPIQKKRDKEYFFVRVYIDNDFEEPKKAGLFHPGYFLKLNDQKPLEIKELDFESELAKRMPFVQKWYHIYLVTFPKTQSKELRLIFGNSAYGTTTLPFQKP